jgi:hypothetical protein
MNKFISLGRYVFGFGLFLPFREIYAAECGAGGLTSVTKIIDYFTCILASIVPVLISLSVVSFIWGIIQYFLNPDNEEKRKAGKGYMLWGLIALFVITSMWGLVAIFSDTFGVGVLIPQLSQ